jgi:hypothetical protein
MLYKLVKKQDKFDSIEPIAFKGLPREKELEDLIAKRMWDVLFEGNELMVIRQERAWQPEADIYALNKQGDLIIFELKREHADAGAVHQVLRYCEKASRCGYEELQEMFRGLPGNAGLDLQEEHKLTFELDHHLDKAAFNSRQRLVIIGSAGDDALIRNVSYWKNQGLALDFIPYRVYSINGESYFEFFSLPYDSHINPAFSKGVLFDTCGKHFDNAIWYMCENDRVAAFGDQDYVVGFLKKNDIVFLYQRGIIAAGKVIGPVKNDPKSGVTERNTCYRTLEWLSSVPVQGQPYKTFPAWRIKQVLGYNLFWARTMKTPYLPPDDAKKLLDAVIAEIGPKI